MTKTQQLLALCEAATPGPWHHVQAFQTVGKLRTIHGAVPAQRVDFVSTEKEPVHKRVIIPMETRESHTTSNDMAFIAAANPETIKQLVELCRLQHEAITKCTEWGLHYGRHCEQPMEEAIAAFNKFEGGE